MSLNEIRSMNSNDLILSCKWCLAFTAVLLLYGLPLAASWVAAFGMLLFPFQTKSFQSLFKYLRYWVLLSAFSFAASVSSYLVLKLADNPSIVQAYSCILWSVGTAIHELAGGYLAHSLYEDYIKEPEGVQKTVQFLEVRVRVLKGRNLVAKDHNMFGRPTTSDPYVKVFHEGRYIGETAIVWKTLNPEWNNELFHLPVVPKTLARCNELELFLIDRDNFKSDDPMGVVYVPIPKENNVKVLRWYKVQKGDPKSIYYCPDPTGDLQVEIELRQLLSRQFKREIVRSTSTRNLFLAPRKTICIDPAMPAKSTRRFVVHELEDDDDDELSDDSRHTDDLTMDNSVITSPSTKNKLSPVRRRLSKLKKMPHIHFSSPITMKGKKKRISFLPSKHKPALKQQ